MIVVIIVVNALFWRPLTAWSERVPHRGIRGHRSAPQCDPGRAATLAASRTSSGRPLGRLVYPVDRATAVFGMTGRSLKTSIMGRAHRRRSYPFVPAGSRARLRRFPGDRVTSPAASDLAKLATRSLLGLATFARVVVLVVVSTLIWVPIGVWIGLNPTVTRLAQPVVQVLASFPANFLFPLFDRRAACRPGSASTGAASC